MSSKSLPNPHAIQKCIQYVLDPNHNWTPPVPNSISTTLHRYRPHSQNTTKNNVRNIYLNLEKKSPSKIPLPYTQIACTRCHARGTVCKYICATGRSMTVRIVEHEWCIWLHSPAGSALAEEGWRPTKTCALQTQKSLPAHSIPS